MKCKIQWHDEYDKPTPDENDAIGIVQAVQRIPSPHGGTTREDSDWYPICADHAKQLDAEDMKHWRLKKFEA